MPGEVSDGVELVNVPRIQLLTREVLYEGGVSICNGAIAAVCV